MSLAVLSVLLIASLAIPGRAQVMSARLKVEERVVFDGYKGWKHNGITYNRATGGICAEAANGDVLCTWTAGYQGRDAAPGNCALMARSTDKGQTWSEPRKIVPPKKGFFNALLSLFAVRGGRMIAIGGYVPWGSNWTEVHLFRMVSDDSGHTWSDPNFLSLHGNRISVSQGPVRLSNGELLFPAVVREKRMRPLVGLPADLARAGSEEQAWAMPKAKGISIGKFQIYLYACAVLILSDENSTEFREFGHIANRPLGLLEPTCVELEPGHLVMLMRAEFGGFLWRADSRDFGRTWTNAWQTDIPNPSSLSSLVKLPDGRIVLIHNNSGGIVGQKGKRNRLSIWISADEMKTWNIKQDVFVGEQFSYPTGTVIDGKLVFGYDLNRSQVRFATVHIDRRVPVGL